MKKILKIWLVLLLTVLAFTGCSIQTSSKKSTFKSDIPYEIYFQGFLASKMQQEVPTGKIILFTNHKDWFNFYRKYVSRGEDAAAMFREIDWKKEDLIYFARTGAKGWYVGDDGGFLGYSIKDHYLEPKWKNVPQRKETLAVDNVGDDSILITYHLWTIVKKKDMPKGIKNFMEH